MNITIVDNDMDRDEVERVMECHARKIDGECPDWYDTEQYPRKQWLFLSSMRGDEGAPFIVVDNREGECFVEGFATLDGALLYLCDCHMTCEHQEDWDYPGSVKDRGGFDLKEGEAGKDVSE